MSPQDAADFVSEALATAAAAQVLHWSAASRSHHEALGTLYERLPDMLDRWVEEYLGRGGELVISTLPQAAVSDPAVMVAGLRSVIETARPDMPPSLQAVADEMVSLIDRSAYLLRMS